VPGEGRLYEIEGRVVRRGRKVVFCEGDVRCECRLIAKGNLTKVVMREKSKL
jgi:acyl-coenzyme A thioesterase PaaI-like protein